MNLWTCQIQEVEMTKTLLALSRIYVVAVQSLSHVWLFVTPWTAAQQASCPSLSPRAHSTHFHWVSGSTQPPSPLLPSSPPAFNLFQHQGLFYWVSSSHQVAKVLELQHQSFQWIFRIYRHLKLLWDFIFTFGDRLLQEFVDHVLQFLIGSRLTQT